MNWLMKRFTERTSLDGIVLIAVGGVVILMGPFAKLAAYAAIGYGVFTLVKGENND